ncbi:MAG: hypothetical protein JJU28_02670 [Cyclobacteriaceae bacterium]|nr:hypothetical protein [Cyclobacteriaceae bacterium]
MAVVEGKTASIMTAYNKVMGEFASQNERLIGKILRDDWGFEGFVSTDWILGLHNGEKGINAGLDVEMPFRNHYGKELKKAIKRGDVTETEIDQIVHRILKTHFELQ